MKSDERGIYGGMARIPRPEPATPAIPTTPGARPVIDEALARELAVKAQVDPRSILREYATPGSVRGMAGRRARTILIERGLLPPGAGLA